MLALVFETSFGYRVMGLLHILTAVAAFGPTFLYPTLRKAGQTATIASLHTKIVLPSLVLLWVLGMGLAGIAELSMSEFWLAASLVVWAGLVCVSWFLIRPALTDDSPAAASKLMAGTGITHLGLVIGLILMIWKPGL